MVPPARRTVVLPWTSIRFGRLQCKRPRFGLVPASRRMRPGLNPCPAGRACCCPTTRPHRAVILAMQASRSSPRGRRDRGARSPRRVRFCARSVL